MTGRIVLAVAADTAARAVDTAFELAADRGVPLLAVSIWHDPDLPLGGWLRPDCTARWDAAHAKARRELDRRLERARTAHPEVQVTAVVADDDPVTFLTALSTRADLLVVGRSTRPGDRASPVDVLVREAACPVLVVPPPWRSSSSSAGVLASSGGETRPGPRRQRRRHGDAAVGDVTRLS
jgi:nucleotide-binding universal stress UspA family protein